MSTAVLFEGYDAAAVEENLADLAAEEADEVAAAETLNLDSAAKSAAVQDFVANNKILITDQHARMSGLHASIKAKVASNQGLEAADAEYAALVASEEVMDVSRMLSEMNAMSGELHSLLIDTGRKGRPPM